ncbi:MAG: T9SS type A sorting domain-containing protein [Ferruginibacter sp.]
MKKCILTFLSGICFISVFAQSTHDGALSITDATFNRPAAGIPPTELSITGTAVFYDIITFEVPIAGLITFRSTSIWDNFAILYGTGGFNPALPLDNALEANDDFAGPNSQFTYNITTTGTYTLVICSFKNDVTGPYNVSISAATPLPLKLLSFTAGKSDGKSNIIKWASANESNLNTYQVQRSSDNSNFLDLINGTITAKNNSSTTTYSFLDNYPAIGYNYYRLKIAERSGRISYSPVAVVKNTAIGTASLKVFPNPTSDNLQIEVKSMLNKKAFVSVINSAGMIMQSGQYSFNNQAVLSIDIKKLPAGKYYIRTTIDNEETTIAFVKE